MKGLVKVGIAAALVVGVLVFAAAPASATHVTCGQTITKDTTLDSDLDCPGDGIVIGADKITLNLNGHTVAGRGCSDQYDPSTCVSQDGIVNSAGHDRVVIENGTITKFENAVIISDGDRNQLVGLKITQARAVNAPGTGISMQGSDRSLVSHTQVIGGLPAILLSDSDRNTIEDSHVSGGVAEHYGDGLQLVGGSDKNRLIDNDLSGEGYAFLIESSRDNVLEGNTAIAHLGNALAHADHNTLVGNTLPGGTFACPIPLRLAQSSDNLIRDNDVATVGACSGIDSDSTSEGNVIESNRFGLTDFPISVQGSNNLVRKNTVTGADVGIIAAGSGNVIQSNTVRAGTGIVESGSGNVIQSNSVDAGFMGIQVVARSTAAVVEDNLATHAFDDGIHVDAPGTLIRRNVADDNGDLGIEAVAGVIDGGGNRASGNGNPLQCLNVVCK